MKLSIKITRNVLLTISILQDGFKNNYLGDYPIFGKFLKKNLYSVTIYLKTIGESSGKEDVICDEQEEVYGFVPNAFGFSFSTADKKGNVPNFIQSRSMETSSHM